MDKQILIIILLLFNSLLVFIPIDNVLADGESGGNIVGDTIYWENAYANLSVYPHTAIGVDNRPTCMSHTQLANITWKAADNSIDVAFRFNDSLHSGHIWLWNGATWQTVTMEHTTYNNQHYYYYTGFNVVQDTTYHFKWYYNFSINKDTYKPNGKWDLMAKLSSESIQEALSSGHYIILDPFWGDYVDFTTFTEVDTDNEWEETSTRATVSGADRNEPLNYVYKDYGVGYFGTT